MNIQGPTISFRDLLAYTDYLAQRWLNYFRQNPQALDIDVGGRTPTLRDLVTHIFQVEHFFADLLLQEDMKPTGRPAQMEAKTLEELQKMHQEANQDLAHYIDSAEEQKLETMRTMGPVTVSNRKILAQAVLQDRKSTRLNSSHIPLSRM